MSRAGFVLTWRTVLLPFFLLALSPLSAEDVAERLILYSSGHATPFGIHPWNMAMESAPGGLRDRGACLWFNTDWQAKPWAGVRFDAENGPTFSVDKAWLEKGFIRFHINVTVDRHGNIGGGDAFQILPLTRPRLPKYQAVRSRFIDRGRGMDEEQSTWQEVLVPLSYFTQIEPGHEVHGLSIQTRNQIERTFSLDDVGYVRFEELPEWILAQRNEEVIQDWVEWPDYADLPAVVKAERRPIAVQDGAFIYPDGSRAFLLNPYCREDSRPVYGVGTPGKLPPTWGLYDREKHGWIYDEVPTDEALCRLGFNSYSVTPDPAAWWGASGYKTTQATGEDFLPAMARRVTLPYFVDLVSWPWTMGRPGLAIDETQLPPDAATQGRNHWTQYRIIGAGRQAWLDLWTVNARRYREAGVDVAVVELMNEPAYMGESQDHHAEFEQWLRRRYGSVEEVNRTWDTTYATLADASRYHFSYESRPPAGQVLDYDDYLAGRFEQMIAEGVRKVSEILPQALVGLQPMGGFMRTPREAVWKHRIARHESVVLTPTGGGRWTRGSGAAHPAESLLSHPMADAPIENDLLLAVAGDKMVVDNETYLRGQTRQDTRNRLWEHVVCGLDGLTVFSWSKRGWVWWNDRAEVQTDADKFPYCALIPLARRTDALRGILDFSIEVQSLAPVILPKPWGPQPRIGVLYSWDHARRRVVEPALYDKLPAYYAALRYSHWNLAMLPSDQVIEDGVPGGMDVIVAGGLTHVEPQLPAALRRFVDRGGILILGECDLSTDVHGHALPAGSALAAGIRTGVTVGRAEDIAVPEATQALFPGRIGVENLEGLALRPGVTTVLSDSQGRPVAVRAPLGSGAVYVQGADAFGYPLAKLLHAMLSHAGAARASGEWLAARITEEDGRLAPNVLLSRRSYGDRHAILLHNRDRYRRTIRLALPGLTGDWNVHEALADSAPAVVSGTALATRGVRVTVEPSGPAVLLIEKAAPSVSP